VLVEFTRNISIGQVAETLSDYTVDEHAAALALPTKAVTLGTAMRWDVPGRVVIEQNEPLPISVLGIITDVNLGGRASV
jgi:hypothetical protein